MHAMIWGCNPFLVWEGTWAHACAPNIWKWLTSGLQPLHSSKRSISLQRSIGRYVVYVVNTLKCLNPYFRRKRPCMQHARGHLFKGYGSTTSFCCALYGIVCCNCISAYEHRHWKILVTYSPPLFVQRILIFLLDWFYASTLKSLRR